MISVVIPLYNKEAFIAEAIESVLNQTFREFELIVVNDGSTDSSLELATNFKDDRLKIISIERSGVSIARNTGINNAKFKWIAFLDADDWWDTHFLEEITSCITAYPNHKLFASGRTHVFPERVKRYENKYLPKDGETAIINYFQVISGFLPPINSSNAVIQKDHFKIGGFFNEKQKMHEDHDLWIRLSLDNEVVFVNKNLSFYRNTEEQSASKLPYEAYDFSLFLATLIKTKDNITPNEKKHFLAYCNRFILLTYIKNYSAYTRDENELISMMAKKMLTGKYKLLLSSLYRFPYKKTYPFFKLFKITNGRK